jgi:ribosomal protein S18 acetylase RimI-like enzyme
MPHTRRGAPPPPLPDPPDSGLAEGHSRTVERIAEFGEEELAALCEATNAAIIEGGGFGWVHPQARTSLESYFRGILLVPERVLFVARLDGLIVGSVQLVRPSRNNEAQAFSARLEHSYVAPYARGHGLARVMTLRVEDAARGLGYAVLNLDVRETQEAAIALYESLGYIRWGVHPCYARASGQTLRGIHYYKVLQPGGRI